LRLLFTTARKPLPDVEIVAEVVGEVPDGEVNT
jgi:hypothetical protein